MNKVINFEVNKDIYGSLSNIKVTIESSCLQDLDNIYQNSVLDGFQFKDIFTEYNKPQLTGNWQYASGDISCWGILDEFIQSGNCTRVWSDESGNLITGWK